MNIIAWLISLFKPRPAPTCQPDDYGCLLCGWCTRPEPPRTKRLAFLDRGRDEVLQDGTHFSKS